MPSCLIENCVTVVYTEMAIFSEYNRTLLGGSNFGYTVIISMCMTESFDLRKGWIENHSGGTWIAFLPRHVVVTVVPTHTYLIIAQ